MAKYEIVIGRQNV